MPQLIETKKKITSVQNTQKITKAMELVAANKMRSFQRLAVSSRAYTRDLLSGLALMHGSLGDSVFAESRSEGKRLFVTVTSDKGLCGALNQRTLRAVFDSSEWNTTPPEDRLYLAVGRKSVEAAKARNISLVGSFSGLKEDMSTFDALTVIERIVSLWNDGTVREVFLVAPEYVNAFTYTVKLSRFLPFTRHMAEQWSGELEHTPDSDELSSLGQLFLEPDEDRVLEALSDQVCRAIFLSAFFELKATEYSSRMIAMRNATDAASDIISNLTLEFNKARQAAITQQLAEIIGAVDAMES